MKDPFCNLLAGCALAMLFVTSPANAANDRIVFSGAVVEPTCSTGLESVVHADTDAAPVTQRLDCGRTAVDAGRTYSREVLDLTMASRYHDRLLDYFASYAPLVTGGDAAKVVVRTYD